MNCTAHHKLIVGIAEARVTAQAHATLSTYSLGSCIAVCMHDAVAGVAGLLHFQLPASSLDPARAAERPLMFADTGIAALCEAMTRHGAQLGRTAVTLVGGAATVEAVSVLGIGRRNHTAARKALWQRGLLVTREDVGGSTPRTVHVRVADGAITVTGPGGTTTL